MIILYPPISMSMAEKELDIQRGFYPAMQILVFKVEQASTIFFLFQIPFLNFDLSSLFYELLLFFINNGNEVDK